MNPNDPRLIEARKKAAAGQLTEADLREVVQLMREGREAAHIVAARSKAKKAEVDTDALLKELF